MTDATTQPTKTDGYHAHVCYESESRSPRPTAAGTIATKLGIEARELSDEPRGPHALALTRASAARRNDAASLSDISTVPSVATLRSSMFIGPMSAERT